MRALILFIAVPGAALLAGALAGYPLYLAASLFTEVRFEKVISNSTLICGLIASLFYLRIAGGWGLDGIGLRAPRRAWRKQFLVALAAGAGLIVGMEVILLTLGVHQADPNRDLGIATIAGRAGLGLIAGILIGTLEEVLFRGALYGAAERGMGAALATLLTSAVYATAHYLKYPAPPPAEVLGWMTWAGLYPKALRWLTYPFVYDAMAAFFLLGVLLCMLRRHFGHIIAGIGLHAGIVAALLPVKYATSHVPGSQYSFLVSRYDNYQGWLASACLAAAIIVLVIAGRRKNNAALPIP